MTRTEPEPAAAPDSRESQVVETFVALADTLVADYDVADFMHMLAARSVRLLPVAAAGLLLSDQRGQLQVVAASDHRAELLDLLESQRQQGPSWDCFSPGRRVAMIAPADDAEAGAVAAEPWPAFTRRRRDLGFHSVYAIPLRLREDVIGTLNLFRSGSGALVAQE